MKNIKNTLLIACAAIGLAACSSTEDNPSVINVVDEGEMPEYDGFKDAKTVPGDDFFKYCNGGYMAKYPCGSGTPENHMYFQEVVSPIHNSRISMLECPSIEMLKKHHADDKANQKRSMAVMQNAIEEINSAKTLEEAYEITGRLIAQGAAISISFGPVAVDGVMSYYLDFKDSSLGSLVKNEWVKKLSDYKFLKSLRPLTGANRRAYAQSEWPMLNGICKGFGVDPSKVMIADEYFNLLNLEDQKPKAQQMLEAVKMIQSLSLDEYKINLISEIENDIPYVDEDSFNAVLSQIENTLSPSEKALLTYDNLVALLSNKLCGYELSKKLTESYITPEIRSAVTRICLEVRKTFADRVNRNTWMSDATKANVLDKLNSMKINVGGPENWFEEGLPDLSKNDNIISDLYMLRKAKCDLVKSFEGKQMDEVSFHVLAALMDSGLSEINAFYFPNFNSMNILPAFCLPPVFDPENNEADQYACAVTYGHEMTHGFDSYGANIGKGGSYSPLWANEVDMQHFKQLSQSLVDYFNSLEVMPEELPGVYCDGKFTLAENIADLGGIEIAYETYTNRLKAQGFAPDEMKKQQKLFFEFYGNRWADSYNKEYALIRTFGEGPDLIHKDTHSLNIHRVNGMVVNMDDWYEFFNVKSTNKMYVPVEKRIHIW